MSAMLLVSATYVILQKITSAICDQSENANTNLPCENTKIDIWCNSNLCLHRGYLTHSYKVIDRKEKYGRCTFYQNSMQLEIIQKKNKHNKRLLSHVLGCFMFCLMPALHPGKLKQTAEHFRK